jgi:hypothetical protein
MKRKFAFGVGALVLWALSCDSANSLLVHPTGAEGGPCYGNLTCDDSLTCVSNLCVQQGPVDGGGQGGSTNGQGGDGTNGGNIATGGSGGNIATGGSGGNIATGGSGGNIATGGRGGTPSMDAMPPTNPIPLIPNAIRLTENPGDRLVGSHASACSSQVGAGDRWCAFFRAAEIIGRTELWVVNASERLRGGTFTCTATGPHCIRLNANLSTGQASPEHPYGHGFSGNTLIFYADAVSGLNDQFKGTVYAWRPGWVQARRITNQTGYTCTAHPVAAVALCMTNLEENPTLDLQFDLHAGLLVDANNAVLPRIDRIQPNSRDDVRKWNASFDRSGEHFVYSTGRTLSGRENLWVIATATMTPDFSFNPQTTLPLLTDASRARVSNDGSRIFWLSAFNYSSTGDSSGVLKMASFPSGANPITVSDDVGAFSIVGQGNQDRGIAIFFDLAQGVGTLRFLANSAAPNTFVTIATGVRGASMSNDGRFASFSRAVNEGTDLSDLSVANVAQATVNGAPVCALQRLLSTDFYGVPFIGEWILWTDKVDPQLSVGEGWMARASDCGSRRQFAVQLDFWFDVQGDLLYSDDTDIDRVSIRLLKNVNGTFADTPTLLATNVERVYGLIQNPKLQAIVAQVGSKFATSGLFLIPNR